MSGEEARKLLGGYAAGVLTPEECQALFDAALESQELFDELAREESLRALLSDSSAKAHLLAALDERSPGWHERLMGWVWGHAVGVAAVAGFLCVGGYVAWQVRFSEPRERVRVIALQPSTIEVNGADKPRRQFDLDAARKAAPAPQLPPPPVLAQRPPAVPVEPRLLAMNRSPAAAVAQPPAAPPVKIALAPEMGLARSNFRADGIAELDTGAGKHEASGGGGARGGAAGGAVGGVLGRTTQEVTVTAQAMPIQTASSEKSTLTDANQLSSTALKGRDLAGVLQLVPGVNPAGVAGVAAVNAPAASPVAANAKLDPSLKAVVARVRSGAKPSADESKFVIDGEAYVRMTLTSASPDSLAQLKGAGFTITRQEGNELTGHVAPAKLEAIAQLPFVVWIAPR